MAAGLYCLQTPTWASWCWAGLLRAGPSGVVSGAAAGYLHGFVAEAPQQITIFHRGPRLRPLGDSDVAVVLKRGQRVGRGDPTRASVEVALLDVARESSEDVTVAAVTRAFQQRLTTPTRVLEAVSTTTRVSHRRVLFDLCQEASDGVESLLEWRFHTVVLRPHGLPSPERQAEVVRGSRTDALWRDYGLVAELDGRLGHQEAFRDMARDNRLVMRGLQTLRYGWHDVIHRPCEVAWQLHEVLSMRGWAGARKRCRRCRRVGLS